ncbi:MAG: hypothetical protein P1U56_23645 [Saprospiraceae bacterium]|nr:hypothetical protein [Saprospiraceae bacterium]
MRNPSYFIFQYRGSFSKWMGCLLLLLSSCFGFGQELKSDCLELFKQKSKILLAEDYTFLKENHIVDTLIQCQDFSIGKNELIELWGEPDFIQDYYSGIEKCNYTEFVYFLKPTYKSKWHVGLTLKFPFKKGSDLCLKIRKGRMCE